MILMSCSNNNIEEIHKMRIINISPPENITCYDYSLKKDVVITYSKEVFGLSFLDMFTMQNNKVIFSLKYEKGNYESD